MSHTYKVTLCPGLHPNPSEDHKGNRVVIDEFGNLVIKNDDDTVAAYASGQWRTVTSTDPATATE
jgi:hypothetical protein